MAKAEIKMPEDFLLKVSRLGNKTDEIVEKTLKAGGSVVLSAVEGNLLSDIGIGTKYPSRSTGELAAFLGLTPVRVDKNGIHNIKIGFDEPRRNQPNKTPILYRTGRDGRPEIILGRSYNELTNAMLANVIEYGKHGQPARPFLRVAESSSRQPCIDAMKAKLGEEIENI